MSKSRVKRAVLTDCEVSECVVIGTEFRGMRLRFGVWKNGRLVGRVGDGEVVFEEMDVSFLSPFYLWSWVGLC
jgi:beta-galactosidase/beta-glucuronidase